jgi:OB-fold nucleic acid binding protein
VIAALILFQPIVVGLRELLSTGVVSSRPPEARFLLALEAVNGRARDGTAGARTASLTGLLAELITNLPSADQQVARILFGFDGDPDATLRDRRVRSGASLGSDPETVRKKYEPQLLERLARNLLEVELLARGELELANLPCDETPTFLTHTRDIRVYMSLAPARTPRAELTGLASRSAPHGGIVFVAFHDATGSIQVVADQSCLPAAGWRAAVRVRPGDRVRVRGTVDRTRRGELSVFADDFDLLQRIDLDVISADLPAVTERVLLARLRTKTADYFRRVERYEEMEPAYLTASEPSPIEGLSVRFPGYGADTYLAPSPGPQLRSAIVATGYPRFFCIGRCFTGLLRDGYTSAEGLVLCATRLDATIESMCALAERAVKEIFSDYKTGTDGFDRSWIDEPWLHSQANVGPSLTGGAETPEVQVLRDLDHAYFDETRSVKAAFRICWPAGVIAEGHVEELGSSSRGNGAGGSGEPLTIGALSLYLERVATGLSRREGSETRSSGLSLGASRATTRRAARARART